MVEKRIANTAGCSAGTIKIDRSSCGRTTARIPSIRQIESDLGLNVQFVRGEEIPLRNCWHFSTLGSAVEVMFYDESDFVAGMNRIYVLYCKYQVIILAFALMDTHIHFILYGDYSECNCFIHEYIRLTSMEIQRRHGKSKALLSVPVNHQDVDTADYLKKAICYVCKNAPDAGLPYITSDYPWSSAPLYFRNAESWASPAWIQSTRTESRSDIANKRYLKTRSVGDMSDVLRCGDIIFPGEYVAIDLVERVFRTHKSFNYFISKSRADDIESRGGILSQLSIPIQEMRQHKNELCEQMFGAGSTKYLNTTQRIRLARALKSKYNSSSKQIARICGLVYKEVADELG